MPSSVTPSEPFIARNVPHSCTTSPRGVDVAATPSVAAAIDARHPANNNFLIVPSTEDGSTGSSTEIVVKRWNHQLNDCAGPVVAETCRLAILDL
jgi:hypothetical protein